MMRRVGGGTRGGMASSSAVIVIAFIIAAAGSWSAINAGGTRRLSGLAIRGTGGFPRSASPAAGAEGAGRRAMDHIDGFRQYLSIAEEDRLERAQSAGQDAGTVRALSALCHRARRGKRLGHALCHRAGGGRGCGGAPPGTWATAIGASIRSPLRSISATSCRAPFRRPPTPPGSSGGGSSAAGDRPVAVAAAAVVRRLVISCWQ